MKKLLVFILIVTAAVVGWGYYQFQPLGGNKQVFVVSPGESLRSIGMRLEKTDLIRSWLTFVAYTYVTDQTNAIQAGSFRLDPSWTIPRIVSQMKTGKIDVWVTFLEGWRREQYAWELSEKLNLDPGKFIAASRGKEGYLFPDSYLFPHDFSADNVVDKLVQTFESKWQLLDTNQSLTQKQIVILASLVEREAKTYSDRRMVAGVLINRLNEDWPLQVDATVQYARDSQKCKVGERCDWWAPVTKRDLDINSPYNTYRKTGLPPGSICNPSLSSLKAVIDYQQSDYWFYLSDETGKTYFSKTLEEHNQKVQEHLR